MKALWIRDAHVVTNDAAGTVLPRADILVQHGRIAIVWPSEDLASRPAACVEGGCRQIDARQRIVLPGFINAHMHSNESFEQGAYDRLTLETWLVHSYPPFGAPQLTPRQHYLRTMLCAIQSIRSGVTTIQDDFLDDAGDGVAFDAVASAWRDAGIRAVITTSFLDTAFLEGRPFLRELLPADLIAHFESRRPADATAQIALYERNRAAWHRPEDGTHVILGPISPQRCSEGLLRRIAEISAADSVPVHCHVDETRTQALTSRMFFGKSLVAHLDAMGLLTERLTLNHAIWLTENDLARMGEHRVSITHNPLSNLKLGSGLCAVDRLLAAGVNVALGTDGTTTSDTPDMVEAYRLAALLHRRPGTPEAHWVSAQDAFHMATVAGARSTGLEGRTGRIAVGQDADLVLLDRRHLGFVPLYDAVRQLAFSATSEAIDTVIARGRIVMQGRRLTCIDEDAIRDEITEAAELFRRLYWPAMQQGTARILPSILEMQRRARGTPVADHFINIRDLPDTVGTP